MEFLLPILFILSLSIFPTTAQFIPFLGDPCANDLCGKGRCELNSSALLGFDCGCDSGWTKMEFFGLISTPCVFPNCSNFKPPLPPFPEFNISSPCNLIWCGDGNCVVNGTTHYYCQCNDGSDNAFNATALPCFKKEWSLEIDCGGVRLGQDSPPPPASGEGNDQNHNSPQGNGSSINVPKFSWSNGAFTTILLITIFLLFW